MFELAMAASHSNLLPAFLLQAFDYIFNFHLAFLARNP
jgi:hypothetical protein